MRRAASEAGDPVLLDLRATVLILTNGNGGASEMLRPGKPPVEGARGRYRGAKIVNTIGPLAGLIASFFSTIYACTAAALSRAPRGGRSAAGALSATNSRKVRRWHHSSCPASSDSALSPTGQVLLLNMCGNCGGALSYVLMLMVSRHRASRVRVNPEMSRPHRTCGGVVTTDSRWSSP